MHVYLPFFSVSTAVFHCTDGCAHRGRRAQRAYGAGNGGYCTECRISVRNTADYSGKQRHSGASGSRKYARKQGAESKNDSGKEHNGSRCGRQSENQTAERVSASVPRRAGKNHYSAVCRTNSGRNREHGAAEACAFVKKVDFPKSDRVFDEAFDQ